MSSDVPSLKAPSRSRTPKRPRQLELSFSTWGGARRNAGRKPRATRSNVSHRARPVHDERHPVHVTMRAARRLPSLRQQAIFLALRQALAHTSREWFRVVHFSVQTDHVHLIVEATDKVALSRGMAGVSIRLARAFNRVIHRKGNVFHDRYHCRALATPREVRHGLVYVLLNFRKHLGRQPGIDPASSGFWFDGWKRPSRSRPPGLLLDDVVPIRSPRTWTLAWGGDDTD